MKTEPITAPVCPKLPTVRLKDLTLRSRYILAPLAGYTLWAYRMAVRSLGGVGLATTDLVNTRALLIRSPRTMELIHTTPEDRPFAVQIYGSNPAEMVQAAQWLQSYGVSSLDINMGCPVHKVTKGGGGSAMMCSPQSTVDLVRQIVEAVRVPVTVKMRLGWDETSHSAPFFAREFEQAGVAAVTIHGRTRAQGFHGAVDRAGIRAVVEAVDRMPVFGNGDVKTVADAATMLRETGCTGIAIGRGALLNPWIFQQLAAWEETGEPSRPASYEERLDFMQQHFDRLVQERTERFGCIYFRKVANWYCRVLKPGHEIQQRMVMISSVADFEEIVAFLRQRGPRQPGTAWMQEADFPVPRGPVSHW